MEDPQAEIINAVCGFLSENEIFPRRHYEGMVSHCKIEVVNRDGDFPVTIRLQFLDGQFCGVLAGATLSDHLNYGGVNVMTTRDGLNIEMKAYWFDISDPGFLDQVLLLVQNPYTFLEK